MSTALLTTPARTTRRSMSATSRRHHRTLSGAQRPMLRSVEQRGEREITDVRTSDARVLVSATSLDVDGEVRAMVRPRVPNYALRRAVVGAAAVVALVVGLAASVGVLAGLSASTASASAAATAGASESSAGAGLAPTVHVAQPGETLWSIAGRYRGDVDRDRYIDALIRLNGGTEVQAGGAVWLP